MYRYIKNIIAITAKEINHHFAQIGEAISKGNLIILSFQTPSLLEDLSLKIYLPGGKLEYITYLFDELGTHLSSKPSSFHE